MGARVALRMRARVFRAARRVRVVGTRACVDLFASVTRGREGVGVSGPVDMGGWVLGGCACGSAHACTCLPRGAARACGGHPSVRRPFRGRHSRTFETRSTRGPNGIPQNFFQSPPRRESGNDKFNPHPRRPACQTVKTLSNFRKRQFSLLSKTSGEAGRTHGRTDARNSFAIGDHPAASHCLHLE